MKDRPLQAFRLLHDTESVSERNSAHVNKEGFAPTLIRTEMREHFKSQVDYFINLAVSIHHSLPSMKIFNLLEVQVEATKNDIE
jgi:hypothetical protein